MDRFQTVLVGDSLLDFEQPPQVDRMKEKIFMPDTNGRIDGIDEKFTDGIDFFAFAYFHRGCLLEGC